MRMNFNSFNSNPGFGSYSSRPIQMPHFDSNTLEDGPGFAVQRLVNDSNYSRNPSPYGQNYDPTPQRGQFGIAQLGLSQRFGDVTRRSNYPPPNRVQVQSFIDYLPVENQSGVSEITVTEVVKTKFLTSNFTRDRVLAPHESFIAAVPHQEQNFPNRSLLMPNQQPFLQPHYERNESLLDGTSFRQNRLQNNQSYPPNTNLFMMNNDPFTATRNKPSFYPNFPQNNQPNSPRMSETMSNQVNSPFNETDQPFDNFYPMQNQPNPNFINLRYDPFMTKNDEILDPEPVNVFVSEQQDESQNHPSGDHLQKPINELLDEYYKNLVGNPFTPRNQEIVRKSKMVISDEDGDDNDSDDQTESEDHDDDGRTHSLYRQKYGPYTCPKCNRIFLTSQEFAAHVAAAHYKFETFPERKKRLEAKYKKKKLRLVHSSDGITIVPDRSFKETSRRRKVKRAVLETGSDRRGKKIVTGTTAEGNSLVNVEVKMEYL